MCCAHVSMWACTQFLRTDGKSHSSGGRNTGLAFYLFFVLTVLHGSIQGGIIFMIKKKFSLKKLQR